MATLLPISMALMKVFLFFSSLETNLAEKEPCSLSKATLSLLTEIKAISIPEKKAEKRSVITIIAILVLTYP